MTRKKEPNAEPNIRIIPLGGIDRIGMNITAIEYKDTIIVIDCGAMFADDIFLEAEKFVPDTTYLEENKDKVKAILITHAHEDHIGALPFVDGMLKVPVYGTRFTIELIKSKYKDMPEMRGVHCAPVKYGDIFEIGDFTCEYIYVNHSIPGSAAIALRCEAGTIVHTGDFKIDFTPVGRNVADLRRFAEIGKEGVLAVLNDSTNALRAGFSPSESSAGKALDAVFRENPDGHMFIASFASNVDRIQQIANISAKYKRPLYIDGRSMITMIPFAKKQRELSCKNVFPIDASDNADYLEDNAVFLVTGSQGEPNASLSKLSNQRNAIAISYGDTVVFSSSIIPGNEKAVSALKNKLAYLGANVVPNHCHASGHAYADEIKLMYSLLQPKFIVPLHGEFIHRQACCLMAQEMGYSPLKTALLPDNGYVLEINQKTAQVTGRVPTGCLAIVDGYIIKTYSNGVV